MRHYLVSLGKFSIKDGKKTFAANLTIREFPSVEARDFTGKEVASAALEETVVGLDTDKQHLYIISMVPDDQTFTIQKVGDNRSDVSLKNAANARRAIKRGESLLYLAEIYPNCETSGIARYLLSERDTFEAAAMDYAESIPGDVLEIEVAVDGSLKVAVTEKVL